MARKKIIDPLGVETAEKNNTILFKVNRPLTKSEHNLLLDRMKEQEKRTGMTIIVIPYSVDHMEGES